MIKKLNIMNLKIIQIFIITTHYEPKRAFVETTFDKCNNMYVHNNLILQHKYKISRIVNIALNIAL